MQTGFAVHPEALYEISEPPVQTGQAERHAANGLESGVERASSDAAQKGCGQSGIGAGPLCETGKSR